MVLCRLRPQGPNYAVNKSSLNGQPVGPSGQGPVPLLGMIAMAIALPPPTVHEVRLEPDMFVTRVAFDFRIIHCEPRFVSFYPFIIFFSKISSLVSIINLCICVLELRNYWNLLLKI